MEKINQYDETLFFFYEIIGPDACVILTMLQILVLQFKDHTFFSDSFDISSKITFLLCFSLAGNQFICNSSIIHGCSDLITSLADHYARAEKQPVVSKPTWIPSQFQIYFDVRNLENRQFDFIIQSFRVQNEARYCLYDVSFSEPLFRFGIYKIQL